MEICHVLVGSLSDAPGQVTSSSAPIEAPPQEESVVHPVTYMRKEKMIPTVSGFSAVRKYYWHLLTVESHLYQPHGSLS